jgi:hypothetical protein
MPVSAPVIKTTCVLILRSLAEPREIRRRFDGAELFIPLREQKAQNGMRLIPLSHFAFLRFQSIRLGFLGPSLFRCESPRS